MDLRQSDAKLIDEPVERRAHLLEFVAPVQLKAHPKVTGDQLIKGAVQGVDGAHHAVHHADCPCANREKQQGEDDGADLKALLEKLSRPVELDVRAEILGLERLIAHLIDHAQGDQDSKKEQSHRRQNPAELAGAMRRVIVQHSRTLYELPHGRLPGAKNAKTLPQLRDLVTRQAQFAPAIIDPQEITEA